jgi:hypothetical protein
MDIREAMNKTFHEDFDAMINDVPDPHNYPAYGTGLPQMQINHQKGMIEPLQYNEAAVELQSLKDHVKMLEAMIPMTRADPVVCCQHCDQPTLYDRPCAQCGGPPERR